MLLERIVRCRREWPLLPGHHVILSCLLWIRTEQHPVHYGREAVMPITAEDTKKQLLLQMAMDGGPALSMQFLARSK
jgi:hypothetical protein